MQTVQARMGVRKGEASHPEGGSARVGSYCVVTATFKDMSYRGGYWRLLCLQVQTLVDSEPLLPAEGVRWCAFSVDHSSTAKCCYATNCARNGFAWALWGIGWSWKVLYLVVCIHELFRKAAGSFSRPSHLIRIYRLLIVVFYSYCYRTSWNCSSSIANDDKLPTECAQPLAVGDIRVVTIEGTEQYR
jgi:hypothetical protein